MRHVCLAAFRRRAQGDLEGAIRDYTRAIEMDANNFKSVFNRGFMVRVHACAGMTRGNRPQRSATLCIDGFCVGLVAWLCTANQSGSTSTSIEGFPHCCCA